MIACIVTEIFIKSNPNIFTMSAGSMTKRTFAVTVIAVLLILTSASAVVLEYRESHDLDLTYPCDMTFGGGSGSVEYSEGVREIYNSTATLAILFSVDGWSYCCLDLRFNAIDFPDYDTSQEFTNTYYYKSVRDTAIPLQSEVGPEPGVYEHTDGASGATIILQ